MRQKEESVKDLREALELLSREHVTIKLWFSSSLKREQAYVTIVRRPKVPLRMFHYLCKMGWVNSDSRNYPFEYTITEKGRAYLATVAR